MARKLSNVSLEDRYKLLIAYGHRTAFKIYKNLKLRNVTSQRLSTTDEIPLPEIGDSSRDMAMIEAIFGIVPGITDFNRDTFKLHYSPYTKPYK